MSERSSYEPGEFRWVDVVAPDTAKTEEFYAELMGWEAEQHGGGYGIFRRDGKQVAGYGPIVGEQPPHWNSYVSVEGAADTAAKVTEAGGTVLLEPSPLPGGGGTLVVFQDAEGAVLSAVQPDKHPGAELVNEVGSWTWNQIATNDLEVAKKFYGAVFGWSLEKSPDAPPDIPFSMWQVENQEWEEGLAGAQLMDETMAGVPPHWQVYLCVGSAEEAVETTRKLGGEIIVEPLRIPVGVLAVMNDPQGAAIGVLEPDYPEPR